MPIPYHPPVKRSVESAGHKTSISLEPMFWDMLSAANPPAEPGGAGRWPSFDNAVGRLAPPFGQLAQDLRGDIERLQLGREFRHDGPIVGKVVSEGIDRPRKPSKLWRSERVFLRD